MLLKEVLSHLSEQGCAYVDVFTSSPLYGQTIKSVGLKEEVADKQYLPVRLAPVEKVYRVENFAYFAAAPHHHPSLGEVAIAKSDIDGDAPANLPLVTEYKQPGKLSACR